MSQVNHVAPSVPNRLGVASVCPICIIQSAGAGAFSFLPRASKADWQRGGDRRIQTYRGEK